MCHRWIIQSGIDTRTILRPNKSITAARSCRRSKRRSENFIGPRNYTPRTVEPLSRFAQDLIDNATAELLIISEYYNQHRACLKFDPEFHWYYHPDILAFKSYSIYNSNKNCHEFRLRKKLSQRKCKSSNPTLYRRLHRDWIIKNYERLKQAQKRYRAKPYVRMVNSLRKRTREFIKRGGNKQSASKLISCDRKQLMDWIESKFNKGMSWSNYGEWHVDHKLPCASFDLRDSEQQRRCFHFTNLQPMWAKENINKSDKIIPCQPELTLYM